MEDQKEPNIHDKSIGTKEDISNFWGVKLSVHMISGQPFVEKANWSFTSLLVAEVIQMDQIFKCQNETRRVVEVKKDGF